jgi:2-keto-3-deoxy-L-rhamnonate aldolase RhmA
MSRIRKAPTIKKLLAEKELLLGPSIQQVCQPWLAKVYADAGADFVFLENEHGLYNPRDVNSMVLAARLCGLPVVAKSAYVDRGDIARLIDTGVGGVQLPMTETADQMRQVVRFAKYPPEGERAVCLGIGNSDYASVDMATWLQEGNEEVTVIAHIESRRGLEAINDILAVPGVDIMFIGMFDLSISLGLAGQFDHPQMVAAVESLLAAALKHGKVPGMGATSYRMAEPWIRKGFRFIETGSELEMVRKSARELIGQFPGHGVGDG